MSDRLLPHSPPDEQGVLGCIMESPGTALPECIETLTDELEVFYDLRHQEIYRCFQIMSDQGTPIDLITLRSHMMSRGLLEQVGGVVYLQEIQDSILSVGNLPAYMATVKEKFILRKMIRVCTDAACRLYNVEEGTSEAIIDSVEQEILSVRQISVGKRYESIKPLVKKVIDKMEEYHQRQGRLIGLKTGFPDLDTMTGGLQGGKVYIIAGRPSMGKSSLAMNISENVALVEKVPVGLFTFEMSNESLVMRSICTQARVDLMRVTSGQMDDGEFKKISMASAKLSGTDMHFDESDLSISQLRARARRMKQALGIKLFVIDYLQLMTATNHRGHQIENRQQEIAAISRGCKKMSTELDVPVILLSQLNRELDKSKGRKPTLADLRESGSIEQDADFVGLLHKPDEGDNRPKSPNCIPTDLIIAKQRGGPTGELHMMFLKTYTKFEMAAKIDHSDVPNNLPYND